MTRQSAAFEALLDELTYSQQLLALQIFQRIRARATLSEIEEALRVGGVESLLARLNIRDLDFMPLRDAVESSFYAGAGLQSRFLPVRLVASFDRRHVEAERFVLNQGARLIRDVSDTTKEGIRHLVQDSLADGRSLQRVALDLRGVGAKGIGGQIGLTPAQSKFIHGPSGLLSELSEIVPPSDKYFKRAARPKAFDAVVRKAIKEKTPLPRSVIQQITRGYTENLIKRRAEVIARTETHTALNTGKFEQMRQMAENAGLNDDQIMAKWQSVRDARTRDTHRHMNGKEVSYGTPFNVGGNSMRFPGDTSLGASRSQTINCRCTVTYTVKEDR